MSLERGTTGRLSITRLSRKFSLKNREYDKVEDMHDTRLPVHNEEAFQHGIQFKSKYIGSLEIARPTCKIDIITAMRRIRYEFKVKGIRKRRCYLDISTQGVKVLKRKKKRRRKQYTEEQLMVMQHPVYRIFYVSHDSQDLKIFSYITREVPDNTFRCNVFKAYKKGAALHIVRSLGQAFDVCHKLNPKAQKKKKEETSEAKKTEEGEGGEEGGADTTQTVAVGTDLDAAMRKLNLENGEAKTTDTQTEFSKDLMQLQFDPFSFAPTSALNPNPYQAASVPNGAPFMNMDPLQTNFAAQHAFFGSDATSMVPPPPLTVSNTSMSLPDFPDGADTLNVSQAAAIPPPHAHLAFISRPRPRPGSATSPQGQTVENPFTDPTQDSPTLSIGQPLGSIPEMSEAAAGNPFKQLDNPPSTWGMERQRLTAAVTLLTEQLKAETASRIESQARVEHLLMQNKELLSHLQKLMAQLQQLQELQLLQLTNPAASSSPMPEASATEVAASPLPVTERETSPPVIEASPPPTANNPSPPPAVDSFSPTVDIPSPPLVSSPEPTEESAHVPVTEDYRPFPTTEDTSLLQEIDDLNFQRATEDFSPLVLTEEQANLLPTTDPFAPIPVSYSPTSTHTDGTDTTSLDAAINSTINTDTEQLQPSTVSVASS